MSNGPTNGSAANWTPAERKVWAASKGLPPGMLIISDQEMLLLHNYRVQAGAQIKSFENTFNRIADKVPDDYLHAHPDLVTAVGGISTDAENFKKAVLTLLPKLRSLRKRVDAATKLAGPAVQPVVLADLLEVSLDLEKETEALNKVVSLRRDKKEGK